MTSTVKSNGHTVVPKKLRDRFKIKLGTTLDWQEDGDSIRVVNVSAATQKRRLRVVAALGPRASRATRPQTGGVQLRFLLDTNILSEAGKKQPHSKVLNWLLMHEPDSGVPSVALGERYQGAHNAPREQRIRLLAELDALVHEAPQRIIPFDTEAAKVWGEYISRPALKLKPRSYPDTQIAAIALSRGLTLVTPNTQDFPEVPVLNPFED